MDRGGYHDLGQVALFVGFGVHNSAWESTDVLFSMLTAELSTLIRISAMENPGFPLLIQICDSIPHATRSRQAT